MDNDKFVISTSGQTDVSLPDAAHWPKLENGQYAEITIRNVGSHPITVHPPRVQVFSFEEKPFKFPVGPLEEKK